MPFPFSENSPFPSGLKENRGKLKEFSNKEHQKHQAWVEFQGNAEKYELNAKNISSQKNEVNELDIPHKRSGSTKKIPIICMTISIQINLVDPKTIRNYKTDLISLFPS